MLGVPEARCFQVVMELAETCEIAGTSDATAIVAGAEFIGMIDLAAPGRLPAGRKSAGLVAFGDVVPLSQARPIDGASEVERGSAGGVEASRV